MDVFEPMPVVQHHPSNGFAAYEIGVGRLVAAEDAEELLEPHRGQPHARETSVERHSLLAGAPHMS